MVKYIEGDLLEQDNIKLLQSYQRIKKVGFFGE